MAIPPLVFTHIYPYHFTQVHCSLYTCSVITSSEHLQRKTAEADGTAPSKPVMSSEHLSKALGSVNPSPDQPKCGKLIGTCC